MKLSLKKKKKSDIGCVYDILMDPACTYTNKLSLTNF